MTMERLARAFTRQWMRWLGLLLSAGCIYWVLKDVQLNHLLQMGITGGVLLAEIVSRATLLRPAPLVTVRVTV